MEILKETEPRYASKEHEIFIRDLLEVYKENRILWDKTHPKYKNKHARNIALDIVVTKCREHNPEIDADYVRNKIDALKCSFRREYKKVQDSKKKATSSEDIYTPTLWYYNLLIFTVSGDPIESLVSIQNKTSLSFWNREYTVLLIELFKKYPELYSPTCPMMKSKRVAALKKLTEEIISETGKTFTVEEVRRKISALKDQFRKEYRARKNKRHSNKGGPLWCFDLLLFLKNDMEKKKPNIKEDIEDSDHETENIIITNVDDPDDTLMDIETNDSQILLEESYDDIFDTIGKNIARKLRDMSDDQRKYAEHLINEIMYHGLMENLTFDSRLSLDDT